MATKPRKQLDKIERRDFLKKTGTVAGAIATGFPGIISGRTITNALKVGLVGCGGRGLGAAAQALTADPNNELTAVADIDEAIVQQATTRLKGSTRFGAQVKIDHPVFGLDGYEKVINGGVDVVLLATPPGFRPQHLTAAVNANKHIFCEKPCATDSPGVREVLAAQKLSQTKNLALVSGDRWRYNNMIRDAVQKVHDGAIGRLVAHYSTYYTNPVKPMPPESARPAGMSDIEWQIRNWYNFTWLCGDSLVEQAVHNADKIMWIMHDQPPLSAVGVGGRAVPANGGNIYDHFAVSYAFPNGYRVFLANRQSTGCFNGTLDYVMGTDGTLLLGAGKPRIEGPDGQVKWQFEGEEYDMYQREHDVLFASIRAGKPKNDDLNLATSTLLAIMGRQAAYTGQQVTWEQAMNSQVSLVPKPVDWNAKHEVPGLAVPELHHLIRVYDFSGYRHLDEPSVMKLCAAAILGMVLVAMAESASRVSRQAASAVDPKEMAAVGRIRALIEERGKKTASAPSAAYTVTIPNTTVTYGMARVAAGEFLMGSAGAGGKTDERPQHQVQLDAFWMQAHEVTWDAYLLFMFADQAKEREHPDALVDGLSRPTAPHLEMSFGRGNNGFPAISMTQHAANKFAEWLSAKTGEYYRLPTEAEWEYACRAGATTAIDPAQLGDYAWFAKNSAQPGFAGGTYHTIGTKKANAWGLYDMLGNVMEWTLDQYAPYTAAPAKNPWVASTAPYPHAVRGGSWHDDAPGVGCTVRVPSDASWKKQDPQLPKSVWYMTDAQWLGFRLVRPATLPSVEEMYRAWNNGVALDPY